MAGRAPPIELSGKGIRWIIGVVRFPIRTGLRIVLSEMVVTVENWFAPLSEWLCRNCIGCVPLQRLRTGVASPMLVIPVIIVLVADFFLLGIAITVQRRKLPEFRRWNL